MVKQLLRHLLLTVVAYSAPVAEAHLALACAALRSLQVDEGRRQTWCTFMAQGPVSGPCTQLPRASLTWLDLTRLPRPLSRLHLARAVTRVIQRGRSGGGGRGGARGAGQWLWLGAGTREVRAAQWAGILYRQRLPARHLSPGARRTPDSHGPLSGKLRPGEQHSQRCQVPGARWCKLSGMV